MEEQKISVFKKIMKKIPRKYKLILSVAIIVILVVVVIAVGSAIKQNQRENNEPQVSVTATLERIVKTSDLSTFEAVYNGIAKVMNEKKPEKVDFYVSYEAKVKAGIDVNLIELSVDESEKTINITLPEVKITDKDVKIESLDYIFENDKANTENVSAIAYKACIADVENEASTEDAIFELAEENAKNIIRALVSPFAIQNDVQYDIVFN